MESTTTRLSSMIDSPVQLRRVGRWTFPVEELVSGEQALAELGRDGSLRIFFGPGRRVRLANGVEWRIKAATMQRHIVPIIKSPGGTVALSGPFPAKRTYGISGKDFGLTLLPLGRAGLRRPRLWALRQHETDVATIDDRTRLLRPEVPVPIAAVLMAFTLVRHGIPGETDLRPLAH